MQLKLRKCLQNKEEESLPNFTKKIVMTNIAT